MYILRGFFFSECVFSKARRYKYCIIFLPKGLDFNWCKACDKGLPKPDICFYLESVESDLSQRGGFGEEKYEKMEFQQKVK